MMQVLGLIGAFCILIPFGAVQLNRLKTTTWTYQLFNFAGGALLGLVAVVGRQYGFILLEGVWVVMSVVGIGRLLRGPRPAA